MATFFLLSTYRGRFSHGQNISFIADSARLLSRRFGKDLQTIFSCIKKSVAKCFLPTSMKAAKLMNKITSNNFLINVYHY